MGQVSDMLLKRHLWNKVREWAREMWKGGSGSSS